jgi:nucleoside-diphosphate-sugar epimerase
MVDSKLKICILGANGHISKSLIYNFLKKTSCKLYLYTRNIENTKNFVQKELGYENFKNIFSYDNDGLDFFAGTSWDVIINGIGVGTNPKFYFDYFTFPEYFDNLVIDYLMEINQDCLYINFSSGAIYGNFDSAPAIEYTINPILVNYIDKKNYYSIARLYTETKHRSFDFLNIVDIRLFSYFSRFVDIKENYFIPEIIRHCKSKKIMKILSNNMLRDFLHPNDLFSVVLRCIDYFDKSFLNFVLDTWSLQSISKFEILEFFKNEYNLRFRLVDNSDFKNATGTKNYYFSENYHNASEIGYSPKYTSLQSIENESKYFFKEQ